MKLSVLIAALLAVVPLVSASYSPLGQESNTGLSARSKDDSSKGNSRKGNSNNHHNDSNNSNNSNNNDNNDSSATIVVNNAASVDGITIVGSGNDQVVVIWINNGGDQPTQTINAPVTVTQTVTANPDGSSCTTTAAVAAATHTVTVGGPGGLNYSPDEVHAAVGDMVVFKFLSQNHTVTQSTFEEPCVALAGGMDSGFVPNPNNTIIPEPMVAMQVITTDPIC